MPTVHDTRVRRNILHTMGGWVGGGSSWHLVPMVTKWMFTVNKAMSRLCSKHAGFNASALSVSFRSHWLFFVKQMRWWDGGRIGWDGECDGEGRKSRRERDRAKLDRTIRLTVMKQRGRQRERERERAQERERERDHVQRSGAFQLPGNRKQNNSFRSRRYVFHFTRAQTD